MRKIGYLIAGTVINWILFAFALAVCGQSVQSSGSNSGIFIVILLLSLVSSLLNTRFLVDNVRVIFAVKAAENLDKTKLSEDAQSQAEDTYELYQLQDDGEVIRQRR